MLISDWARLRGECGRYEDAHYARATKITRSVQLKAYLEFCEIFADQVSPYPCSSSQLCMYMSFLARRMCYSSIKQYVSALNNHLKDLGLAPIDYSNHRVKKCMAGIRRILGDMPKQAAPLLPKHLREIFGLMVNTRGNVALRAAILVSFRALLRKCHVSDSESALLRSDFIFYEWGMMVRVRMSKTIQYRERIHLIPVSKVADRALCAVHWVGEHFRGVAAPGDAHAFRIPRGVGSISMPYNYYLGALRNLCMRAGLNAHDFSTHSLRRGGATFLRMCGASIYEIKERGDWKSDAVFEYLKASVRERLSRDIRVATILSLRA